MYKRILVPLDGSDTSERGLREAIRIAHRQRTHLVLLHVIDDFPKLREIASNESMEQMQTHRRSAAEELLSHGRRLADASQVQTETSICIAADTLSDTIVDIAAKTVCELIVLGTHGRSGIHRALLGSVAEGVSRRSPVPVMLVPPAPAAGGSRAPAAA